jgi:hypothetical protein
MSTLKKSKLINQISIAAQIVDGSITIDSTEEFDNILKLFPDDPELQRVYSDLLVKNNRCDAAAQSYGKAAKLFIDSDMMLPALVSKSLQWKIKPPVHLAEARHFFSMLQKGSYHPTPVNDFFGRLSYPAMLAILYNMAKVRLAAGKIVKKNGEGEKDLYFIVSGALRETTYHPVKNDRETLYKKSTLNLSENDFFGEVYPFEEEKLSQSYIEAVTRVELIKISKANLVRICGKYPEVEPALSDLCRTRFAGGQRTALPRDRKGGRHILPLKINLKIATDPSGINPLILAGYSRDISIGGICVVLEAIDREGASLCRSVKNTDVQISLPSEAMALSVSGTIVWSREVRFKKKKTVALGIQFKDMSPKLRGMVFAFAGSISSKN